MAAGAGTIFGGSIQVDLTNPSQSGAPGDTIQFTGTITNLSATDTVFFNGASSTSVSADLAIDITPFLVNAPLFLAPGEVSPLFDIFDIAIAPGAVAGPYLGNIVTLLGGVDSNAFDTLLDISADVNVATSSSPEPGSALLLLVGLGVVAGLRWRDSVRFARED